MRKFLQASKFAIKLFESAIRNAWVSVAQRSARNHLKSFLEAVDYPASAGTPNQMLRLTGIGASGTIARLIELVPPKKIEITTSDGLREHLKASEGGSQLEDGLRKLFDFHGSDKGSSHGYSLLYAHLLQKVDLKGKFRILEIGLGTNRATVPSNMGPGGRPGASLRAWRDMGESIEVVGLDVDRKVLINEDRISSFYLDQLDMQTWASIPTIVTEAGFDLIVDDGLHAPLANLNTVISCLPLLKKGGVIVIEDIPKRALPVWTLAKRLIEETYDVSFYQLHLAHCVVIRKKD